MKVLFDTSTLIASIIESHPKHEIALSWLKRAKNKEFNAIVSAHSLLEIYSVLTTAPFKPKILPVIAKKLIDINIRKNFNTVLLSSNEYFALIDFLSSNGFRGGIVYDALIYACARKSKVDKIVTSNVKDYTRLNNDNSIDIISI